MGAPRAGHPEGPEVTPLPSRRGVYYLTDRGPDDGGLYLWVRWQPRGEEGKRKVGRRLEPLFAAHGWGIRHKDITDRRCLEVVAEIRSELDTTAPRGEDATTPVLDLVEGFAGALRARGRNERYVTETRRRLRACLGHVGERGTPRKTEALSWRKPGDIRRHALEAYLTKRRGEVETPHEVNHDIIAWSSFGSWLVRSGVFEANPLARMEHFKRPKTAPPAATPEEVGRILVAAKTGPPWLERTVLLIAHTGMRPVEVARLTWGAVDLAWGAIRVHRKGLKDWLVPINAPLAAELERTPEPARDGPVVPGFPYEHASYAKPVRQMMARADPGSPWRPVRPHSCRSMRLAVWRSVRMTCSPPR